jgi:hypothetical protein
MTEPIVPTTLSASFSSLSEEGQHKIQELFDATGSGMLQDGVSRLLSPKRKFDLDVVKLAKQRIPLAFLLDYYTNELQTTNPAIFTYLTSKQKNYQKKQLLFTYYLIYCQYQLDEAEGRKYRLQNLQQTLTTCAKYIGRLPNSPTPGEQCSPQKNLEQAIAESEKYLILLGMTNIAPWFAEKIREISDGKTKFIKNTLDELNNKRLSWSWGDSMLVAIMQNLPNNFFNKRQTRQVLVIPEIISGYLGWILHYLRFGINLFLLLKHSIKNPWMSPGEQKISDRFKTQWDQRKFDLITDSAWATVNLVCFFWLVGSGPPGFTGNLLTLGFYLVDLVLVIWKFYEESTKHNAKINTLEREKKELEDLLQETNLRIEFLKKEAKKNEKTLEEAREKADNLEKEIANVDNIIRKESFDWKYQRYGFFKDLTYALGMILAFTTTCCLFFPPAAIVPATALMISAIGATLSFVINIVYTVVTNRLEVAKMRETSQQRITEYNKLLEKFDEEHNPDKKKLLYLQLETLKANSIYHEDLADFQSRKLVQSILIEALLPGLIFGCFTFLPFGQALGAIATNFVIALATTQVINEFEPKSAGLPEFDEGKYAYFVMHHPPLKDAKSARFFDKNKESIELKELASDEIGVEDINDDLNALEARSIA